MFLHSKKGQVIMIGTRLQETESGYNKEQPLPLIGKVINKLKEAQYFNKLDLIWGYNNVWIKEGDKWKAAFLINKDLCKP